MKEERKCKLEGFLADFQISCKNLELINQAFLHGSLANKNPKLESNERLEFLGDSVLSLCTSEYLYKKFPDAAEGKLTRIRSYVVSEKMLSQLARRVELDKLLMLSWGEENGGGRKRDANLADAFEAFLGAVFLDQGMETVKSFLLDLMEKEIEQVSQEDFVFDYKTELQYIVQKKYKKCPEYKVEREEGPPHQRVFFTRVEFEGRVLSRGDGPSKKKAEQKAARLALILIKDGKLEI